MRVIAGKYKGRHLKSVAGMKTRPTSDKLKEAIFNMIGPYFEGGYCLDLFAGSGALGIEAISRGMEKAIFVDHAIAAIRTIKQNIANLNIEKHCEVYRNDAFRALYILAKRKLTFDFIFLDPPYEKIDYEKLLKKIEQSNIVNVHGIIYIEHKPSEKIHFQESLYSIMNEKKFNKTTAITIIQKMK